MHQPGAENAPSLQQQALRHLESLRLVPVVETESIELIHHYVIHEQVIGFQIPIGFSGLDDLRLVLRPISARDLPPGSLIPGKMRNRALPVASARFAMQLAATLEAEDATQVAGGRV